MEPQAGPDSRIQASSLHVYPGLIAGTVFPAQTPREERDPGYLVQVWHQILVQRPNQHVQSASALLGKGRGFQSGFFTVNY